MENPASWGECQKLIAKVIDENDENMRSDNPAIGYSLVSQIYYALKEAGYIIEIRRKNIED